MSKTAVSLMIKDNNGSYDYKYASAEEVSSVGAMPPAPAPSPPSPQPNISKVSVTGSNASGTYANSNPSSSKNFKSGDGLAVVTNQTLTYISITCTDGSLLIISQNLNGTGLTDIFFTWQPSAANKRCTVTLGQGSVKFESSIQGSFPVLFYQGFGGVITANFFDASA